MEPVGLPAKAGIASYQLPVKEERSHTVEDVGPRDMPMQGRIALLGPIPEKGGCGEFRGLPSAGRITRKPDIFRCPVTRASSTGRCNAI